jgi:hypothetical protein
MPARLRKWREQASERASEEVSLEGASEQMRKNWRRGGGTGDWQAKVN